MIRETIQRRSRCRFPSSVPFALVPASSSHQRPSSKPDILGESKHSRYTHLAYRQFAFGDPRSRGRVVSSPCG